MPVVQKFVYTWPPGTKEIWFEEWLKTLSKTDKEEFDQGRAKGEAFRQQAIDSGRMIINEVGDYVWKDSQSAYKENDPTWEKYWKRWQKETGVHFSFYYEEID